MILKITKEHQAYGAFNGGEIVENKPIGFDREGGKLKPYSNIFYWANAIAKVDSTIGLHPHQGFEIMSFVLEGKIRHYDTKLKEWRELEAGDVQIIRAGNGISHAEHMNEGARMFQIWFDPDLSKTLQQEASYDDYQASSFPSIASDAWTRIKMVGQDAPITMDSIISTIERWDINSSMEIMLEDNITTSIYVLTGNPEINHNPTEKDDFILLNEEKSLSIKGESSLFIIQSPLETGYKTYGQMMQERMRT